MKIDFNLPQDRKVINAWCRHYYATNPVIGNWIDAIVESVYSNFKLSGTNKKELGIYNSEIFEEKLDRGQLKFKHEQLVKDILKEFNVIGEVITYNEFEEERFIIQNPDYIYIQRQSLSGENTFHLEADDELIRVINSTKKEDVILRKSIDKEIIKMVKENKLIPLNSKHIYLIQRINSPYDIRGTSNLVKYFKMLMYDDEVRELFYSKNIILKKEELLGSIWHVIKSECQSDAFIQSLYDQRQEIEEWIRNNILVTIKKQHNLKTLPNIEWLHEISKRDFEFLWSK